METSSRLNRLIKTHGSLVLTLGVLLFALLASVLIYQIRYADHLRSVNDTADSVATVVAKELSSTLAEKQHIVKLFAEDNKRLIGEIARSSGDTTLVAKLNRKISAYFPDYFTMTISDNEGLPYLIDYDGVVGGLCLNNIKEYAKTDHYETRIHPNNDGYHVDVMTKWVDGDTSGILLISFLTEKFAKILKLSQPEGYRLLLVTRDPSRLMEITDVGSRDKMVVKEDYRLEEKLRQRILTSVPVEGSVWDLIAYYEPRVQRHFERYLLQQTVTIFAIFSIVVVIMWYFFRREELRRARAEQDLQRSHANITHLNTELKTKQDLLDHESDLAMQVFDKITTLHQPDQVLIESHMESMSKFSGDMLFTNSTSSGKHYVMLCDFTGHGLPAALGAIPTSEIFYDMTREEASITDIAEEINKKIFSLLPTEYFCCAILLSFTKGENNLQVINCALPHGLLFGADNRIKQRIMPTCLPLGIINNFAREKCLQRFEFAPQDYLCIYTDGLVEARNETGVIFGEQLLEQCLEQLSSGTNCIEHIARRYTEFTRNMPQEDDISIVKVNLG